MIKTKKSKLAMFLLAIILLVSSPIRVSAAYISNARKFLVYSYNKDFYVYNEVKEILTNKNITVTYPGDDGIVYMPENGSVTLLYVLVIQGRGSVINGVYEDPTYIATDEGVTYVYGAWGSLLGVENKINSDGTDVIYVAKTFTKEDIEPWPCKPPQEVEKQESSEEAMALDNLTGCYYDALVNYATVVDTINGNTFSLNEPVEVKLFSKVGWYDVNKNLLEDGAFYEGEEEPSYSKEIPTVEGAKFLGWKKLETPLNDDSVSYVAEYEVTYKVEKYDAEGNVIETEVRVGTTGSVVSVADEDKVLNGYTFNEENENNNLSEELIGNDTVLKLYFDKSNIINTGDNSLTILYTVVCVVSLGIISGLLFLLKRKKASQN